MFPLVLIFIVEGNITGSASGGTPKNVKFEKFENFVCGTPK